MNCEPPFWKNINVLFNFSLQYKPECKHSPFNFTARLLILSIIVGAIASVVGGLPAFIVIVMFSLITAAIIIATTKMEEIEHDKKDKHKKNDYNLPYVSGYEAPLSGFGAEGFTGSINGGSINRGSINGGSMPGSANGIVEVDAFPYSGPLLPDYTPPSARNLFMNVLLDEIKYNPDRPAAAPCNNETVKQTFDDYFRVQWFSDPTDVFGKSQSQRQFVTQPSTTVPNDQGAFADWLYKIPGKTCKEGGRSACLSGTDSGSIPWLNQAS